MPETTPSRSKAEPEEFKKVSCLVPRRIHRQVCLDSLNRDVPMKEIVAEVLAAHYNARPTTDTPVAV